MMMRRNLLLIAIVIVALIVTLGLQGCGNDEEPEGEEAAEGVDPGMEGEMAEEPGMEGETMDEPGMEEPGMGGPPMEEEEPVEEAGAPSGPDADQLVSEGMSAKHDGDYVTAREKLEAAVEADSSNGEARWGLAWIYAEMADAGEESMEQKAIDEFEEFLEIGGTEEQVTEATAALDRLQ